MAKRHAAAVKSDSGSDPGREEEGPADLSDPQAKEQCCSWGAARGAQAMLAFAALVTLALVFASAGGRGAGLLPGLGTSMRGARDESAAELGADRAAGRGDSIGGEGAQEAIVPISAGAAAAVAAVASANPVATLVTTMGTIRAEIFLDRVPVTASNFIDLARAGFYDGLHFHRVIPGFMDQFGCPKSRDPTSSSAGTGGPPDGTFKNLKTGGTEQRSHGGCIQDEHLSKDSNRRGTLSMANTGHPDSGGSQFFLNVNDNAYLDWFSPGRAKHPVFGKIIEGYSVAVAISKVPTRRDKPITPVRMDSVNITGI